MIRLPSRAQDHGPVRQTMRSATQAIRARLLLDLVEIEVHRAVVAVRATRGVLSDRRLAVKDDMHFVACRASGEWENAHPAFAFCLGAEDVLELHRDRLEPAWLNRLGRLFVL